MKLFKKYPNIFIISSPRSGTTWLSKALNQHPSIYCTEGRFFGNYADFIWDEGQKEPRLRVTLDKYINSCFLHHNSTFFQDVKYKKEITKEIINLFVKKALKISNKKFFIDKITPYVNTSHIVAQSISELFPKAKIIFLLRDGRDVVTSGVFHWFNKIKDGEELTEFENKRRAYFLGDKKNIQLDRFFTDSEIEEWALTWAQPLEQISLMQKKHKVLLISYEDMLLQQNEVLRLIFSFIGSKNKNEIIQKCINNSSFKKMSDNREQGESKQNAHIRKGISGDWKNYFTQKDGELFHKLAGKTLLKYNYETNNNWYNELPHKLTRIN